MEPPRKSAQEVEIDHLLAEEFGCDPGFAARFAQACGLPCEGLRVRAATPEPSLGGEGYGDLLVEGEAAGRRVALLIEDKITAGPATRQAARYRAHAARMRAGGWDEVWCVLVASAAYRGEWARFDASLDLESLAGLLRNAEPLRLAHRRGIIGRALAKRASTGVRVPDLTVHRLKADYLEAAAAWCVAEGFDLSFPALRESCYDGDSWIEPIRHPALPDRVHLRHRLGSTMKRNNGLVDLIVSPADAADRAGMEATAREGARVAPFSKGRGIQASLPVPAMSQATGFDPAAAEAAFGAMRRLVHWRLAAP